MARESILDDDDTARGLVNKTRALFCSRTREPISDETAKSMIKNAAEFFSLLDEWEASRECHDSRGTNESKTRNQGQGW